MIINKPPMGWNSWNTFGHNISEKLIMETADIMVSSSLLDAGYEYLVIDDCWAMKERDKKGFLVPDKEKFPNGMKFVSDYVHSKGLKFGMYSCCGTMTCAVYPGSFEYEFQDAETFADWGVDYLKYDYCFKPSHIKGDLLYKRMGTALATCKRDILFSACSWGNDDTPSWIKSTGAHIWRSTGDIVDNWESIKDLAMRQIELQKYNGINCYNDIDMLVVGMYGKGNVGLKGCSDIEYRTHYSLWAILNCPLMIGCDIRDMNEETKNILMNHEIIEINQDIAGRQPFLAWNEDGRITWVKLLDNGDYAIGLFNMSDNTAYCHCEFWDIGLPKLSGYSLRIRDLWNKKDLGNFKEHFGQWLEPHDCMMLRARLVKDE